MKLIFSLLFFTCVSAEPVQAQSEYTSEDAVRLALTNNPSLQAARFAIAEAKGRLVDSRRLPNPELESTFAPNLGGRERNFTIGFNQRFPITSKLQVQRRISQLQVELAQAEVAEFERTLAFQVRTAAVTLATINAQQRLNDRQEINSRDLETAVRRAATVGEGSELDLAQLELESGRRQEHRARLDFTRVEALTELSILLGSPFSTNVSFLAPPLSTNFGSVLIESVWGRRPDLVAAQKRTEAARETVHLARANRWEDIEAGVFTGIDRNEDAPNGLETDHVVGVRVAIPLPLWNRGKGRLLEAQAQAQRAELEANAVKARIRSELASATNQVTMAARHHSIITDLLPKARRIEERVANFHKAGQVSFVDVLRARERRLDLEISELDAVRDLYQAHARYLAVIGTTLQEQ